MAISATFHGSLQSHVTASVWSRTARRADAWRPAAPPAARPVAKQALGRTESSSSRRWPPLPGPGIVAASREKQSQPREKQSQLGRLKREKQSQGRRGAGSCSTRQAGQRCPWEGDNAAGQAQVGGRCIDPPGQPGEPRACCNAPQGRQVGQAAGSGGHGSS